MSTTEVHMDPRKRIALIAHDRMKQELVGWARTHRDILARQVLFATGNTGELLERELGLSITKLKSGPLGGDQQVGARIAEGEIDFLVFFWDPLEPAPHDPDVKALLRMAAVWNIPAAGNRATADFIVTSPFMEGPYTRLVPDRTALASAPAPIGFVPGGVIPASDHSER